MVKFISEVAYSEQTKRADVKADICMGEVFFFSGTKGCDLSLLIGSCEGSHGLWRTYKVKKRSWEMQALIVRSESCLSSFIQ